MTRACGSSGRRPEPACRPRLLCACSRLLPPPIFDLGMRLTALLSRLRHPPTACRVLGAPVGRARSSSTLEALSCSTLPSPPHTVSGQSLARCGTSRCPPRPAPKPVDATVCPSTRPDRSSRPSSRYSNRQAHRSRFATEVRQFGFTLTPPHSQRTPHRSCTARSSRRALPTLQGPIQPRDIRAPIKRRTTASTAPSCGTRPTARQCRASRRSPTPCRPGDQATTYRQATLSVTPL